MASRLRTHGATRIRHIAARQKKGSHAHRALGMLGSVEDGMHYAVGLLLVGVSILVLVHGAFDFVSKGSGVPERVTSLVNSVLFVIIVMEMLRTVMAHFDDAGLQLKPFLIIGSISAVRHILTVGARATLGASTSGPDFRSGEIELAVNAAVVMVLVVGLVLVRHSEWDPTGGADAAADGQALSAQTAMVSSTAAP